MKAVVIGGGPGGIQFTRTVKAHNKEIDITMIRPELYSVIYCALPYVIEDIVSKDKIRKSDNIVTETGAKLVHDAAVSVDFKAKTVTTAENGSFPYDVLVIATGAAPVVPVMADKGYSNLFTVKTEENLENILACLSGLSKKALVAGAGNIGIEMSAAFASKGLETYLVEMKDRVLPNLLDSDMAEGAAQDAASLGVNVKLGTAVTAVEGGKYAAKALLSDGSFIELGEHDPVIFCVGVRPVTGIFEGTELAMDKDGIIIDSRMRTNIEGVLAVGDCASFVSYIDGRPAGGKLATNAVPMGKIAAYNLIGRNYEYKGFINGAITKTKNLRMGGTGFTEEEAKNRGYSVICGFGETTTRFPIMPEVKKVKVKLVADTATGRIIGGQVVGGEGIPGRIDTISLAIQNAMTAGELFNFSYCAQPYQSFFPAGNAIVMAAEMIMNKMEKQPIG